MLTKQKKIGPCEQVRVNWKTSPSYGRKIARPAAASSSCNRQIRFLLAKKGRLSSETLTFLVVPSHPRNRHPADSRGRQSLRGHVRHDLWNRQHLHDYCDDNCDDWATCTLTAGAKTVRATTPIGTTHTVPLTVN